jgi:hypothetical protein
MTPSAILVRPASNCQRASYVALTLLQGRPKWRCRCLPLSRSLLSRQRSPPLAAD